jgi:DNA-directed RNA polymerase specialized sigma24 family protein
MNQQLETTPGSEPGSITNLIPGLKERDRAAIQKLWEHFFQHLVRVAHSRLHNARCRDRGAEDIALEAFLSFCNQLARPDVNERFPDLRNRTNLWRLLVCFTVREAFDYDRKEKRRRAIVGGESALGELGFEPFAGREPAPEFSAQAAELLEPLPLALRDLVVRKMEGYTHEEIAREFGWSVSKVERKLKVIRTLLKAWEP